MKGVYSNGLCQNRITELMKALHNLIVQSKIKLNVIVILSYANVNQLKQP